MSPDKWTETQKGRAAILFREYPEIDKAFSLSHSLRMIFLQRCSKEEGRKSIAWIIHNTKKRERFFAYVQKNAFFWTDHAVSRICIIFFGGGWLNIVETYTRKYA